MPTHEVTNQPPPLAGCDASDDQALLAAVEAFGPEGSDGTAGGAVSVAGLREIGRLAGSEHAQELGRLANENPPKLRTHDRYGHRIDEVEFHPAWHDLMTTAIGHGLHAAPWRDGRPGAHLDRAARFYLWGQAEAGHLCPVSMTYAIVPALRHAPDLAKQYEPLLAAAAYDPSRRPPAAKRGLTAGMSMTEKQGGSDVRANTTTAARTADGSYRITGHKWFTSAPMGDLFMVLAQTPAGVSCFLLPKVLPDGTRNAMYLQRLKDKLGNRSNASAHQVPRMQAGTGPRRRGTRMPCRRPCSSAAVTRRSRTPSPRPAWPPTAAAPTAPSRLAPRPRPSSRGQPRQSRSAKDLGWTSTPWRPHPSKISA